MTSLEKVDVALRTTLPLDDSTRSNLIIVGAGRLAREALGSMLTNTTFNVLSQGGSLLQARIGADPDAVPHIIIFMLPTAASIANVLCQCRQARADNPGVKTVFIVDIITDEDVLKALQMGVDAILSSDLSGKLLLNSLELVLLGQQLFPALPTHLMRLQPQEASQAASVNLEQFRAIIQLPPETVEPGQLAQPDSTPLNLAPLNLAPLNLDSTPLNPPGTIVARMIDHSNGVDVTGQAGIMAFSDREIQILGYLVDGSPNKVIARALGIAETTVKVHVKGLLRKVRASNRTQAAVWALNYYFKDPPSFSAG